MMNDTRCGYADGRDEVLIAYLYDDITSNERASFEAHLPTCARCCGELDELRSVRQRLTRWAPPPLRGVESRESVVSGQESVIGSRRVWWREMPAWAQVAAAMLVLGISAAVANLNVHYGSDGVTIRTGWSSVARGFSRAEADAQTDAQLRLRATEDARLKPRATEALRASEAETPWRGDLVALERQLRTELRSAVSRPVVMRTGSSDDDEIVRRVRALIAESERRQERELALRIAGALNDVNAGRAADLARIKQTLGALEHTTGAELFKQRQQMVNYLNQVSLRR